MSALGHERTFLAVSLYVRFISITEILLPCGWNVGSSQPSNVATLSVQKVVEGLLDDSSSSISEFQE